MFKHISLKTLSLLSLLAGLFVAPIAANAQQYGIKTLSVTNAFAATSTNSVTGSYITLTKSDLVAVEISFKLTSSGTSACVFKFHESLDGTNYDDTVLQSVSITAAGTSTVRAIVPVNVGAVGYFGLRSVENPNANGITNLLVRYVTKPERQG